MSELENSTNLPHFLDGVLYYPFYKKDQLYYINQDPISFAKEDYEKNYPDELEDKILIYVFEENIKQNKTIPFDEAKELVLEQIVPEYMKEEAFIKRLFENSKCYQESLFLQFLTLEERLPKRNRMADIALMQEEEQEEQDVETKTKESYEDLEAC